MKTSKPSDDCSGKLQVGAETSDSAYPGGLVSSEMLVANVNRP